MTQNPDYRPCAGIILINRSGDIFVGQRHDNPNDHWQMPQGGIDQGETPLQGAWRELQEEVGSTKAEFIYEHPDWLFYDVPHDLAPRLWNGQFKGQQQKWFLFQFLGTDADINIQTAHPEFRSWKWAPLHTLPDLVVPFKKDLYATLVAIFDPIIKKVK